MFFQWDLPVDDGGTDFIKATLHQVRSHQAARREHHRCCFVVLRCCAVCDVRKLSLPHPAPAHLSVFLVLFICTLCTSGEPLRRALQSPASRPISGLGRHSGQHRGGHDRDGGGHGGGALSQHCPAAGPHARDGVHLLCASAQQSGRQRRQVPSLPLSPLLSFTPCPLSTTGVHVLRCSALADACVCVCCLLSALPYELCDVCWLLRWCTVAAPILRMRATGGTCSGTSLAPQATVLLSAAAYHPSSSLPFPTPCAHSRYSPCAPLPVATTSW